MNTIIIPTTQNIELEYPVANVGDRIAATLIDLLLQVGYFLFWYLLFDALEINVAEEVWILLFLPFGFYHLVCEAFFNGQSVGKRIMKTQVVRVDGTPPALTDYLLRWLLRPIDVWTFNGLVAIITISATKNSQRLGDLAAGTSVVKLKLVTTFGETIFMEIEDDYQLTFPEIQALSDQDVSILKEVMDAGLKNANHQLIHRLASRVKSVTGIDTQMGDHLFLETVLKDYNFLYGR